LDLGKSSSKLWSGSQDKKSLSPSKKKQGLGLPGLSHCSQLSEFSKSPRLTDFPDLPNLPNLKEETRQGYPKLMIAGVDEVGRGCIAGPVVAGAVILSPIVDYEANPWLLEVTDSKKISAPIRERLAPLIQSWAIAFAIGLATVQEIDEINIFHASHLAMIRAVQNLKLKPEHLLVDGKFLPKSGFGIPATAIIKGDLKCLSIACASILAKVWRDQFMTELDQEYPGYGLATHKGYPTPAHAKALAKKGVLQIHRRSFKTVQTALM
jgi:ribonuclease HII